MTNVDRDARYLALARHISGWSRDPSTKVGAVLVRPDRTIASVGYNGFPRGVDDDPVRLADRAMRLALTVHAEVNAVLNAREPIHGYTLYCTLPPCVACAGVLLQGAIGRLIFPQHLAVGARWHKSMTHGLDLLTEGGVAWEGSILWQPEH